MSNEKLSNEAHNPPLSKGVVISRIFLICLSIPFGWILGNLIGWGLITLLRKLGLDDNLFRFLDAVSLF